MAKVTTNYELPYPETTDTADVPSDMQALAEKIDETLNDFGNVIDLTYEVVEEWEDE